jgi:hypothetical protein
MHVIDITLDMVDSVTVSVETKMNVHNNLQLLQSFGTSAIPDGLTNEWLLFSPNQLR